MKIASIGEVLWDVFPDGERLGGAPFNFAANARRLGHEVLFLSAVGDDERGRRALARAAELGLSTDFIQVVPGCATGTVTVALDARGQPRFTIHRPAAYDRLRLASADYERISAWQPGWIYFGTLHQYEPAVLVQTRRLLAANPAARRFYDVNLREGCYTRPLVEELMSLASVVKLNEEEADELGFSAGRFEAAAITRGERGCEVWIGPEHVAAPGHKVRVADTVGAGDAFAAAFLHGIASGWPAAQIAGFANCLGAVVASRPGAIPDWSLAEIGSG